MYSGQESVRLFMKTFYHCLRTLSMEIRVKGDIFKRYGCDSLGTRSYSMP